MFQAIEVGPRFTDPAPSHSPAGIEA